MIGTTADARIQMWSIYGYLAAHPIQILAIIQTPG
jgi:hypothetical protein